MDTDKIYAEHLANEYAPKDTSKVAALRRLDARAKLPDAALVVLSPKAAGAQPLEPSMRGVTFASPATVGTEVCRLLAVPCAGGWQEE